MISRVLLLLGFILLSLGAGFAQQNLEDVIYLKNGGIVRGTIIEQVPGESIKVQTRDGSVFVYPMDQVERMKKEVPIGVREGPSIGKFGISGHVGTDVTGGIGYGGGLGYALVPGGSTSGYEFSVDYFFHEYDEASGGEKEFTDLSIIGFRTNWLWNFSPNQGGVYFVTGLGFVYVQLDYVIEYDAAVYGQFSRETYDYSSVGNIINLGAGWTSAMGLGMRLETPMLFFYNTGQASAFVPTFSLAMKYFI